MAPQALLEEEDESGGPVPGGAVAPAGSGGVVRPEDVAVILAR